MSRSGDDPLVRPLGARESGQFEFGKLRFLEEGRMLALVSHPRVVRVLELFEENRTAYLVMEYHRGATLVEAAALTGGRLDEAVVLALLLEILDGLEAVHRQGVVHCDVKPSNIYLTEAGVPLLLDFGAARRDFGERTATLDGILSPGYAPFELFQERGRLGAWTDVYGLAATAVSLLAGERPPSAADRIVGDPLSADGSLAARLPEGLRRPLVAALALRAEERTPSAERFRAEILAARTGVPADSGRLADLARRARAAAAAEDGAATGSSTTTLSRPSARRRSRSRVLVTGALVVMAVAAAIYLTARLQSGGDDREPTTPASSPGAGALVPASAAGAEGPVAGDVVFAVVPFGELVELRDASGNAAVDAGSLPLPARLRLLPGPWNARVRYPVTGEVAELSFRLAAGEALRVEHRFASLDARAYFEATGW